MKAIGETKPSSSVNVNIMSSVSRADFVKPHNLLWMNKELHYACDSNGELSGYQNK